MFELQRGKGLVQPSLGRGAGKTGEVAWLSSPPEPLLSVRYVDNQSGSENSSVAQRTQGQIQVGRFRKCSREGQCALTDTWRVSRAYRSPFSMGRDVSCASKFVVWKFNSCVLNSAIFDGTGLFWGAKQKGKLSAQWHRNTINSPLPSSASDNSRAIENRGNVGICVFFNSFEENLRVCSKYCQARKQTHP